MLYHDAVTTGQAASFSPDDPAMAGKMPVDFLIIVAALQIGEDCVKICLIARPHSEALLGVAPLMTRVPLPLALIHQAGAAILLALATALMWRVRRP